jgi:hypothetical protein
VIVRILGDGQFEIDEATAKRLETLDADLDACMQAKDEKRFDTILSSIVGEVHNSGKPLDPKRFLPSDLVLPPIGATLEEVRALLDSERTS